MKHLFIALLLLCTTMATAHDFEKGGIYYDITSTTDFTVEVTYRGSFYDSYSNEYSGNEVIPESVTYNGSTYSVTSIGSGAFSNCRGLTSVVIPNSVTRIGGSAFSFCSGLTSVVIPNSVTSINASAFFDCSGLTSVVIPNSVTSIGVSAFYGCSGLTSVVIPNSVTSISDGAFDSCSGLTSVVIPNSVTSIEGDAFSGCSGLTSVVIPNSVTSIGSYAFRYCSGLTSVVIPNSVTSIGSSAFYGCSGLKEVHISDLSAWCGIDFDGSLANPLCYAHNLYLNGELVTDLVIPDGVIEIKRYAFDNCSGLTSVVIPNSVTSIEGDAFSGCSGLTSVVIPNSVTSIGSSAFYNCSGLTSVVIPNSVTSIGSSAFRYCSGLKTVINFSSLKFSKGSTANGYVAYYAETVINAPNGSVEGDFVFGVIDGVNTLCGYIGAGGDVILPADYNGENYAIGADVFKNNTLLTSVVIPNSVTSIGSSAFYGCSGLKEVHISDLSAWCNIAFASADANPLYYAHNLYLNDELVTDLVIPDGVTSIGSYAFYNCSGFTSVEIPNGVTSIDNSAFNGCSGLKEVHISDLSAWCGIEFVNDSANPLYYAHNLYLNGELVTDLVIPDGVTEIKRYAFDGCSGLTSVVIPNSVTSIGSYAFYNCSGLKKVINFSLLKFSKDSTANGYVAYYAETVINVPNGVIEGDFVFGVIDGVNTLCGYIGAGGDVTLPADYNGENYAIGSSAFRDCSGLTSVVIPNSVTSIGSSAFEYCSGLKTVINFSYFTFSKGSTSYGYVAYYAETVINAPNGSVEGDFVFGVIDSVNTLCFYIGAGGDVTLPADYKGENYAIGSYAFSYCSSLTSVVIGNSVTSVGDYAFRGCSGLKEVHISDLSAWCNIAFASADANPLYYAENLYLNDELLTELTIPDSVTEVKNFAFYNCSGLTSVVVGNSVTCIGSYAFYNCSGLTSLTIGNGVNSIGNFAFNGCTSLKSVRFEDDEKILTLGYNTYSSNKGKGLFYDCPLESVYLGRTLSYKTDYNYGYSPFCFNTQLKSLTIGGKVTSIGDYAFSSCSSLTSVVIDNGVTSIGDGAFDGCSGLKEVHISDLSAWCNIAFENADANPLYYAENLYLNDELLTELTIPDSVTEVKNFAFYNCSGLTSIEILDGVTGIGEEAFRGCSDLEYIYISSTIESIGDYAFAECNNILDIKIGSKKAITASENIFSSDAYNNACLYVPAGRKDFYAKTSPWSNFIISEMDFTGIEDVEAEGERVKDVYYDLSGRVVDNPTNGVYIINGKKVIIK